MHNREREALLRVGTGKLGEKENCFRAEEEFGTIVQILTFFVFSLSFPEFCIIFVFSAFPFASP